MQKKDLFLLLISFSAVSIANAEPSVFGAGNLDSSSPYGLSQSEKKILEQDSKIRELTKTNNKLEKKIESLEATLKSLQDSIQSIGRQNNDQKIKLNEVLEDLKQSGLQNQRLQENAKQQDLEIKKNINDKLGESFIKVNLALDEQNKRLIEIDSGIKKDFNGINQRFQTVGKDINKLKSQMITQQQLNFVIEDLKKFKELVIAELGKLSETETDNSFYDFSKHTNDEILDMGKKNLDSKKYQESIKFFEYIISKQYKLATTYFYLGEAHYGLGNYEDAIKSYKDSVSVYDKSKFMPTLLLHISTSFDKLNMTAEAKTFYNALATQYPQSNEGKEALKLLEKYK